MKLSFKFLQTGGIPLTNDLMSMLEESYGIFEVLAEMAGNLTILAGCNPVIPGSQTLNPGIVAIEGKLYYFEGGLESSTVFINVEEIPKIFQDQTSKTLIERRTVRFGNSAPPNLYNWADFTRLKTLKEMQNFATQAQIAALQADIDLLTLKTAPIVNGGVVFIWSGDYSDIPNGWKECTDLRGKTVFGYHPSDPFFTLHEEIGSKHIVIAPANMPKADIGWVGNNGSGWPDGSSDSTTAGAPHSYPRQSKFASIGQNNPQPINVVNPGFVKIFIEPDFQ